MPPEPDDLEQYMRTAEGPIQGVEAIAPIAAPPVASSGRPTTDRQALYDDLVKEWQANKGGDGMTSKTAVINAAPAWYKSEAPPGKSPWGDVARTLGGAAAQTAQAGKDDPLRRHELKSKDAGRALLAQGLGSLLGGVLDKPQADYKTNQDAALKEAQMVKLGRDSAGSRLSNGVGLMRLLQTDDTNKRLEGAEQSKQARLQAENDPDSDVTRTFRQSLISNGVTPDQLEGLTYNDMVKNKAFFQQGKNIEARGAMAQVDRDEKARIGVEKKNMDVTAADAAVRQKQAVEKDQSDIPGLTRISSAAAPEAARKEAAEFASSYDTIERGSKELAALQNKLRQQRGLDYAAGRNFMQYFGTDDGKQDLTRAAQLQQEVVTALRLARKMGAPQEYELKLLNELVPTPGGLEAWSKGNGNYDALGSLVKQSTREKINRLGYGFPDETIQKRADSDKIEAPQFDVPTRTQFDPKRGAVQVGDMQSQISKAAQENGIDPRLFAALIKQESNGNPNAVSPKGAQGIAQFMPETAKALGIDPNDPAQAIPAAAKMLKGLIDKYGTAGGLAAYNWGEGNLRELGGGEMPAETRNYVRSIMASLGAKPGGAPAPAVHAAKPPAEPFQAQPAPAPPAASPNAPAGTTLYEVTTSTGPVQVYKTPEQAKVLLSKGFKVKEL